MPELPEVETTKRGLAPHIEGVKIQHVILRRTKLRWEIPAEISTLVPSQTIISVERRAKYLLLTTALGSIIIHLGMSGSLRVLSPETPIKTHDHVDFILENNKVIRFNDPRRFGCILWQPLGETHSVLNHLAPEPLTDHFDGDYLFKLSRGKKTAVKLFIMDQKYVVGVGNIYAAEALFKAGISPLREAGSISKARYIKLADAIKDILNYAIIRGGTTLRDFISPDGKAGYFEQELLVYGKNDQPCIQCKRTLQYAVIGQRSTVWCAHCQT